jgi:hypothetical protein
MPQNSAVSCTTIGVSRDDAAMTGTNASAM